MTLKWKYVIQYKCSLSDMLKIFDRERFSIWVLTHWLYHLCLCASKKWLPLKYYNANFAAVHWKIYIQYPSIGLEKLIFLVSIWMSQISYAPLPGVTFFLAVLGCGHSWWAWMGIANIPLQVLILENAMLSIWTNWKDYNWDSINNLIINWMSCFVISKEKRNWPSNYFHLDL